MVNVSNRGEKLKGALQGGRFDKESDLVDGLDLIYDAGQPLHAGRARVRLRHVRLGAIPMFKRSHHRSDFIEDEDVVARIAECSVNEPGTVRGCSLWLPHIYGRPRVRTIGYINWTQRGLCCPDARYGNAKLLACLGTHAPRRTRTPVRESFLPESGRSGNDI